MDSARGKSASSPWSRLVVTKENFEKLKEQQPDWYPLGDGIHNLSGKNVDGRDLTVNEAKPREGGGGGGGSRGGGGGGGRGGW